MEIPVIGIAILVVAAVCQMSMAAPKKTYIVHMAQFEEIQETLNVEEATYFESSLESVSNVSTIHYKYKNVLNGYSTSLTPEEAETLKALPQVLSVSVETVYQLHTTRTPAFLGIDQPSEVLPSSKQLSDVIIGVIDTGVWPESKSFDDTGLGKIPSRWNGICQNGREFNSSNCNKKLIGARFFSEGYEAGYNDWIDWETQYKSPRDSEGHGTHTSSTAAGSAVHNANEFGYASGTARGMAATARVAVYKCCWMNGCFSTDILAAIDKAIDDKVDIMSLSLGGSSKPFYDDVIAMGAFAAMEKGIFVSCAAGNGGPAVSSVNNVAPWITTVAAGTLDRTFPAPAILGNGKNYSGISLNSGDSLDGKLFPIFYAGNYTDYTGWGSYCLGGSLIPDRVRGKIVLCDRGINSRVEKGFVVKDAGGVGMILANTASNGEELTADAHFLPATAVGEIAGEAMKKYFYSDPNPRATILFQGTRVGVQPAPVVAAFSSRGPSSLTPDILKPDLIAPGVNILAAWTGAAGPAGLGDDRRVEFNIISGTSMACPHLSGLAALVKAVHTNWSPAAIKSALMTTAYTKYQNGHPLIDVATVNPSTPYDHGSGHVKPLSALDPGLVYDLNPLDYFNFLCALKYTEAQIKVLSKQTSFACDVNKAYSTSALNYPSFALSVKADPNGNPVEVTHIRTLTNVGPAGNYKVRVISPDDTALKINVVPDSLTFSPNEKKSYTVTFKVSTNKPANSNIFARIEWDDGNKYVVGSPVAVSYR